MLIIKIVILDMTKKVLTVFEGIGKRINGLRGNENGDCIIELPSL